MYEKVWWKKGEKMSTDASLFDFQIGSRISMSMVSTTDEMMTAARAAVGM